MASLFANAAESAAGLHRTSQGSLVVPVSSPSLMDGLPDTYTVHRFSTMKRLQAEAQRTRQNLLETEDGNQWIVVLGLSPSVIQKLDDDHTSLGDVTYRFQWEGTAGLIKVVPSHSHDTTTDRFTRYIDSRLSAMGIDTFYIMWAATSTYKPTPAKGKQGDQTFIPPSRWPSAQQTADWGWPTFVLETGVSESLPRLREDARWWFADSRGDVRIVLLISIKKSCVKFEKWQLAPPNAARPLTRAYINSMLSQSPSMPPLIQQPAATQQAYCAQEVEVTPTDIHGAPIILPFAALFDRDPGPSETDVVINAQQLRAIVHVLF
ncbi:hypothetical protein POX_c04122 [Penicillium oxalicum]|uniref:hypothetical protein n=1 Tax=Penicillium oxalicum TaxID=69781 RepID=UPI0020B84F98|nr:hypothetical protein POX_c04122 [Penicillium oxalicum]KAI2791265.1 hypothetical protein POX_c04122 [Penicillium oxalicum]